MLRQKGEGAFERRSDAEKRKKSVAHRAIVHSGLQGIGFGALAQQLKLSLRQSQVLCDAKFVYTTMYNYDVDVGRALCELQTDPLIYSITTFGRETLGESTKKKDFCVMRRCITDDVHY